MSIPGLEHPPLEEASSSLEEGITLLSFDLKPFVIPESHLTGKCRHISEFNKIACIGEGTHGFVYKVIDTISGETVALKKLKYEKEELSVMPMSSLREITILQKISHCNVVSFYGVTTGESFDSTFLIMEYCPYQLLKVVKDEKVVLEYPQIKCIMAQLCTGVAFIHSKGILHRDLTVTNIIFTISGILKITDFGSARYSSESEMTPNVVSIWYRAPEILFGSKKYTSAIDMWAVGCIFAELLLRRPLFKAKSDNALIKLIIETISTPTESTWPGFSELPLMQSYELYLQPYNRLRQIFAEKSGTCISLLHKLFLYNPAARFSAKESLQHSFFMEEPHACTTEDLIPTLQASDTI